MSKNLSTSQKRVFVDALESFSESSFKENLSMKQERNKYLLNAISYNKLSKSPKHAQAVKELRDSTLLSWNSKLESKLQKAQLDSSYKSNALMFLSQRPGMMLRMLVRLYRLGYTYDDLNQVMMNERFLNSLSYQTLINNLQYFGQNSKNIINKKNIYNKKIVQDTTQDAMRKEEIQFAYDIFYHLLKEKMSSLKTPLLNKKIYMDTDDYNLDFSIIETNAKSDDDTYIRGGLAFSIPEEVKRLRFFVYWNDKKNIDIDLHNLGQLESGEHFHIGWNGDYNTHGVTFSGDIRHSDAAEYIDIDMEQAQKHEVDFIDTSISLFSGANSFKNIREIFTGMMAVSDTSEDTKLYNASNVFFRHDLNSLQTKLDYAYVDVKNRVLRLKTKRPLNNTSFNVSEYLNLLFETQSVNLTDNKDEADIILTVGKVKDSEKGLSLLDNNFFIDYKEI